MATKIPKGSQLLIYPMKRATISGGYKNAKYTSAYGYVHFGTDFDSQDGSAFDVIASGDGVVLGTEFNSGNSIGGVVVIKYSKVYIPSTKTVRDLIVRYYHMDKVYVSKGDKVSAYESIGHVSATHKWFNHVHMEMDTDTAYPFNTPQVSEGASKLLIRWPSSSATIINVVSVCVVGNNQTCIVHPLAKYANSTDNPKYKEKDFI